MTPVDWFSLALIVFPVIACCFILNYRCEKHEESIKSLEARMKHLDERIARQERRI